MNTVVDNAVCRCCSSEGAFKNIKGKYIWMGEEETYIDMLKDCYDIQIIIPEKLNHDLESGICELCITQLRNALNFRKQVLTTEEVFRKRFSDKIQLCESNCIKIEEPSDGLHDDDDGVVDALDFDINVSEVHEYEVPVKEEESEGEVSRSKRSKRTTRSSTIKIKRSKLDRAETSKCDSKKNDEKLQQKVKHLIKKKSKIKSEQDDDWTVSISKKADSDQGEQSGSLVGTVVKFLKPTKGVKIIKNSDVTSRVKKSTTSASRERKKIVRKNGDNDLLIYKHRHNIRELLKCTNATPIRRHGDLGYFCAFCEQKYQEPAALKEHTLRTHTDSYSEYMSDSTMHNFIVRLDITGLKCNLCLATIPSLENLVKHLTGVHGVELHPNLQNHVVPFKFDNPELSCCICSAYFKNFKVLLGHSCSHYRNYICDDCGAGFINLQMVTAHSKSHSRGAFKCGYCEKVFSTLNTRNGHQRSHYRLLNVCGHCGEKFANYDRKLKHMIEAHGVEKPSYDCKACGKIFKQRSSLNSHFKTRHLTQDRFRCSECGKGFYFSHLYKNHLATHSGIKNVECPVCLKAFASRRNLTQHQRTHDELRRFKCDICGRTFGQRVCWKNHMRSQHDISV